MVKEFEWFKMNRPLSGQSHLRRHVQGGWGLGPSVLKGRARTISSRMAVFWLLLRGKAWDFGCEILLEGGRSPQTCLESAPEGLQVTKMGAWKGKVNPKGLCNYTLWALGSPGSHDRLWQANSRGKPDSGKKSHQRGRTHSEWSVV